ncbi:MAG TPA: hypothetical protein VNQ56_10270 [Pseudolabrys sp.]|nr:hypothetical protein [Pseudolabrys sp.]
MKVTLDLSELLEQGKISSAEAERLQALAAPGTSALGINILIGFGVVAVAAGAVALAPLPSTAAALGAAIFVGGLLITLGRSVQWSLLGQICLIVGALMFTGGVVALGEGSLASLLIVTVALFCGAVAARSSLLMAGAVLSLAACFGARTGYSHATYMLVVYEPTVTVVVFAALALAAYQVSRRVAAGYERIAITAARTAVLLVNFGFWIGSLWGDPLRVPRALASGDLSILDQRIGGEPVIPAFAFSIVWALALLAVAVWGARVNRRWVVNIAAVFGAIHFYTQWFERLGANAGSVLLGGLLMLGFGFGLWTFNRRAEAKIA